MCFEGSSTHSKDLLSQFHSHESMPERKWLRWQKTINNTVARMLMVMLFGGNVATGAIQNKQNRRKVQRRHTTSNSQPFTFHGGSAIGTDDSRINSPPFSLSSNKLELDFPLLCTDFRRRVIVFFFPHSPKKMELWGQNRSWINCRIENTKTFHPLRNGKQMIQVHVYLAWCREMKIVITWLLLLLLLLLCTISNQACEEVLGNYV